MLISRIDRGLLANWWFTVDRSLIGAVLTLMSLGVLFSMAASPPVAEKLGKATFHFFHQQIGFMAVAVFMLFACSFLNAKGARRVALAGFVASVALMAAALKYGPEIKGAHRWIYIGPFNVQPSEFVKPCFVILVAWLLAERTRRPEVPGFALSLGIYAALVALLIAGPDFGQTMLISLVFGTMLLVFGISWFLVLGFAGVLGAGAFLAYQMLPHVASRIDRFLSPEKGDTFQVDTAIRAFHNGGLYGTGPGGGLAKQILPDAHTDFIFAVIGEEFGLLACTAIVLFFAAVVLRLLLRAIRETDPFIALSLTGLAAIFGFQAAINMMVNVSLLPAKGMTLPFISYGGSSLIAMAITMGLALALGRRRPAAVLPGNVMGGGRKAA